MGCQAAWSDTGDVDVISIRGLACRGFHGVLPVERTHGQGFLVDLDLFVDRFHPSDDLEATVDYAAVAYDVQRIVSGEPVALIETLAERIAEICLAYGPVARVRVVVHKPDAPVRADLVDISVTVERP